MWPQALQTPKSQAPSFVITTDEVLEKPCSRAAGAVEGCSAPQAQRSWWIDTGERSGEGAGWCGYWQNPCGPCFARPWLAQRRADGGEPWPGCWFTPSRANLATDPQQPHRRFCSTEALQRIEVIHLDVAGLMNFLKNQGLRFGCYI